MKAEKSFSLKEILFNRQTVGGLVEAVQAVYPAFDVDSFYEQVFDGAWEERELKERLSHVTRVLGAFLPADYRAALEILRQAVEVGPLEGFVSLVPAEFVSLYGLDDLGSSVAALEQFTQVGSAEFAVRPFIVRYPEAMMEQMVEWAGHESEAVRRLASEGSRPRLPWGITLPALKKDPAPLIPILDRLRHDPSETVRRSVANNLNDIAKDNPEVTLAVLGSWLAEGSSAELTALARHGLRTLIKAGHPGALALLGVDSGAAVMVQKVVVEPLIIPLGGEITFSFEVVSQAEEAQELVIDYVVHLVRSGGKRSEKVFKLAKRTIGPSEVIAIKRRHNFRPVTTRTYYPGRHAIQPKINGQLFDMVEFDVEER
jgi:3-methyladenine DNA glycosylase AlkC